MLIKCQSSWQLLSNDVLTHLPSPLAESMWCFCSVYFCQVNHRIQFSASSVHYPDCCFEHLTMPPFPPLTLLHCISSGRLWRASPLILRFLRSILRVYIIFFLFTHREGKTEKNRPRLLRHSYRPPPRRCSRKWERVRDVGKALPR